MTTSNTDPNYVNNLNTNQLSDYTFYKSTYYCLYQHEGLLVWVGLVVDIKTDIILDCKWHSTNDLDFKDELIGLSNTVVGKTYDSIKSISISSDVLESIFGSFILNS